MLHVRVVSPPGVTERLIEVLAADAGVRNLVVLPGAARLPGGDAVQFDVMTGSVSPVLKHLRGLHLDAGDFISIENVDAIISDRVNSAERRTAGHRELAPVWEMVRAKIRADAIYPPSFFILMAIAALIGAVGILTNSQILIVGAMVVGPEYGAIIAVALGITERDRTAIGPGIAALFFGFLAAIVVTLAFGLAICWTGRAPTAFLLGIRPVSNLIDSPNLFSFVVAVLAGIVGVVSLTEARANALIGVFISVTTIPAAADVGVSTAFTAWSEAWGSLLQLLLNVVVLIAVGAGGLVVQRAVWRERSSRPR